MPTRPADSRLRFRVIKHVLCAWILLVGITNSVAAADRRPNLVFVIADDCTYRDLGVYGGQAKTPHLNRLAAEGMKFTRCFQAAPMCSPTRHNIYTGLYPVRSGAYPNHTYAHADTQSVVHYLKPSGYRVALSGKTHIGPRSVFSFEYSGQKNPDMQAVDRLFEECAAAKTPVCLFACSNEPHSPWNKGDASQYSADKIKLPPNIFDTDVVRESFGKYLAEITYFDGQVGRILDLLEKHKLADNTLVMVVSEQGSSFPFAKWTCYSTGLQSGMIVRWPGKVKPGTVSSAMVEYVDVLPTFLEAAGIKVPDVLEGKSFVSVLTGQSNKHKSHTYGLMTTRGIINGSDIFPIRTVRDERYRLIWNLNPTAKFTNACTKSKDFQSIVAAAENGNARAAELVKKYHYRPEYELFDCDNDPLEMKNLAEDTKYAQIRADLTNRLENWMADQGDRGLETERDAILRLGKNRGKPREAVFEAWERFGRRGKKKKKKAKQ